MLATYVPSLPHSNLEIKIVDSSGRTQHQCTNMNKRTSQTIYGADIDPMRAEADDTPIPIFLGK